MAIFLLLRRWHIAGKWELVSKDMRQQRSWCILIYHEIFRLLAQYYRKCVRVLDYRRINPLLEEWGQQMAFHGHTLMLSSSQMVNLEKYHAQEKDKLC